MHQTTIDKSILLALTKGDVKAFESIYKMFSKPLYRRLMYILKNTDEVDEIIHNVFLKIWIKRETIDLDKNFSSYLLKIANSMAIDHLRRNIRTQAVSDVILRATTEEIPSVEDNYLKKEEWSIVEEAIGLMPPQRKLIFTMFKLEGKSYKEISDELAISTSTISSQMVIAMKFLRKHLNAHQREIKLVFFLLGIY